MFLALRRFILARWTSFLFHVSTLWGFLLFQQEPVNNNTIDVQTGHDTPDHFPLTEEQLEEKIDKFVDCLDEDAICRLASQHNGQKPCRVVGRDRGSFNVCFFIHFDEDGMRWVVRIPLEPVVQNAWDKVQSEVTTMRYLQRSTTIPIPRIHAYGQDTGLVKGHSMGQPFLICDHIAGQLLNMRMLAKATKEQRTHFYDGLIDILAQLYQLEFPVAGSLMPNAHNEADPAVGGLLSMAANELGRCCQEEGGIKTLTSASQYMDYQYRVLSKTYSLPTEELSRKQAQMELFALDSLEKQIPMLVSSQRPNDPFALAHMDLRCGNIMVTQDLRILAIIDWEFSGTIPRQLFTPPPWITGHDLEAVAAVPHYTAYPEFLQVLEEKSLTSETCAKLRDDWKSLPDLAFPVAQIFRHPSCLIRVYYKFIFPKLCDGEKASVVPEFFERQNIAKTLAVEDSWWSTNKPKQTKSG
ncbi:hypothetical protein CEP54_003915 [Fusarium duplospermum]|uniref:Aminoglycoside phosphotransferase domain-containing protein n=1 Tax=Fusarium duplospermum TaxID=1325734 RepID=A0A428QLB3_9HYPO|nr:hypothetical protein CEP54_003915 [Fusarium duplospermum]